MKNLKRVLSLGLASVMLLGMMVMGASAKDFTDSADIVNTEAVDIMVALKVINGKEDGSYFDPKGNVTRGEMAKMIAVAMNGGSEANTGVKGVPTFTDISGHWAEGWIEYCADMKIIGGRGDGTFDPDGLVTGTEALKMVLTALGYDAEAYHLQGASWAAQTLERARTTKGVKLVEGLDDIVMTEPANRDTAARMIWNGLQAMVVTVAPDQNTNSGEVTWKYSESNTVTLLNQRYNAFVATGTYAGTKDYGAPGALKGEIGVKFDKNNTNDNIGLTSGTIYTFPSELGIDNIGEEVKVVWKNGTRSSTIGPDNKDTIYGAFNTGATRVIRTQMSKVQSYGDTAKPILKIDGSLYDCTKAGVVVGENTETDVEFVRNFVDEAAKSAVRGSQKADGTYNDSPLTKALKKNSGNPIKVVFDENGKVCKVYLTESYIAAVTAINSTNITLNGAKACTLKIEDHDIEEGLERGDVVVVTPYYSTSTTASNAFVSVKKAEVVSGELTSWKGINGDALTPADASKTEDENVVVGGKTYKINYKNKEGAEFGLLQADIPELESGNVQIKRINNTGDDLIGEDFDLYLVNGYVAAMVQTSESANNYSVVIEVKGSSATDSVFNALQLQVMGADGTKEVITVSKDSTDGRDVAADPKDKVIEAADYQPGDIVTYTFDKDDKAEVNFIAAATDATAFTYSDKAKTVNTDPTAADCVLYVQTKSGATMDSNIKMLNADWEVYDIRALDKLDVASARVSVAHNKDGKVVAAFVNLGKTPDGASDETVYGLVTTDTVRVKDYYTYTVMVNGEEYTVNWKNNSLKKGDLIKFRPTADNNYAADKIEKFNYIKAADDKDQNPATGDWRYVTGWAREYNSRDNTLTVYNVKPAQVGGEGAYLGNKNNTTTYAIASDAKIVYIDQDNVKSDGEASISEFGAVNGKMNVCFLTKDVDGVDVIQAMFVEISGKKTVNKNVAADVAADN